jgi:hypothetical protein
MRIGASKLPVQPAGRAGPKDMAPHKKSPPFAGTKTGSAKKRARLLEIFFPRFFLFILATG